MTKEIRLTDVVGSRTAASLGGGGGSKPPRRPPVAAGGSGGDDGDGDDPNFRAPRHTRVPVPNKLKFYCLPTQHTTPMDIRTFIDELTPNIIAAARARFLHKYRIRDNADLAWQVASHIATYMLDPADKVPGNPPRWIIYSPVGKHATVPYFKWFLKHVNFVAADIVRGIRKDRVRNGTTISVTGHDDLTNPANQAGDIDAIIARDPYAANSQCSQPPDAFFAMTLTQVRYRLRLKAMAHADTTGYEANCLALFDMVAAEEPPSEIAARFGISMSAVNQWRHKLIEDLLPYWPHMAGKKA